MAKRNVAKLDITGRKNGKYKQVVDQVIVDKKLLEDLQQFTWSKKSNDGYAVRSLPNGGRLQLLHYYIFETHGGGLVPKGKYLDHANQNKRDNRLRNLQVVNDRVKNANAPKHIDNTTGFKDVFKLKSGKFNAKIQRDYRSIRVGTYEREIEAAHAVNYAYKKLHPEIKIPQNKIPRSALTSARRAAIEATVNRMLQRNRKS